jgi:hypothetical protein
MMFTYVGMFCENLHLVTLTLSEVKLVHTVQFRFRTTTLSTVDMK